MAFRFSQRSIGNLQGVHPHLREVAVRALSVSAVDFVVIEGLRTLARQKQLLAAGATWTLDSRHLTGHAIDIVPWLGGKVRYDWPLYYRLAEAFRRASIDAGIKVRWGGSWTLLTSLPATIGAQHLHKTKPDGAHFELPKADYP